MRRTEPRNLPEFDILVQMAKEQPDELERLRRRLANRVIDSAPDRIKQRLRGLQFQIDARREMSSTPLAACIHISSMMHESFEQMRSMLNGEAVKVQRRRMTKKPERLKANVISFPRP